MPNRPLVSFLIITYNHEPFIREALEAAAAQTYSPMEIVVCDDASTDRTFAIVEAFAASYTGPHRLVIHRNERNLGIAGNCNELLRMARGELLVSADGDDRSLPNRVERSVAYYFDNGRPLYACALARWIDEKGQSVEWKRHTAPICRGVVDNILQMVPGAFGATAVFHRSLIDVFGPIAVPRLRFVDRTTSLRAILMGDTIRQMPEILVEYRQHGSGACGLASTFKPDNAFHRARYITNLSENLEVLTGYHYDLRTAVDKGLISRQTFLDAEYAVTMQAYCLGLTARAMAQKTPLGRAWALVRLDAFARWRILKRLVSRRRELFLT